jgi:MFS family permease
VKLSWDCRVIENEPDWLIRRMAAIYRRVRGVWTDGRSGILVTVSLGWVLTLGIRLAFPVLMPWIQRGFGVNLTSVGSILALIWIAYAVSQFPGGIFADWFGERVVLVGSLLVAALSLLFIAFSPSIWIFLVGLGLFGIGSGLFGTTRFTVLSDVYPDNDGAAIGISAAAGNVGTTLIPVLTSQIAILIGWRYSFVVMLPGLVIAAVGLQVTLPARTSVSASTERDGSLTASSFLDSVLRPRPLLGAGTMFFMSFVYQAFTGFYPTYLVQVKEFSEGTAGLLYGAFFASAIVTQPLGGLLGDRYGRPPTIIVSAFLTAVALAAIPVVQGLAPILAFSVLVSVQLAFWPNSQAYVIGTLPESLQGSGFGLLRTIYLVLAATGPIFVGVLAQQHGFRLTFFLLSLMAVITVPLGLLLALAGESSDDIG